MKEFRTRLQQVSLPDAQERVARAMRLVLKHAAPAGDACLAGLVDRALDREARTMIEVGVTA